MTVSREQTAPEAPKAMSLFERYLTLWVALCIVLGIALGHFFQPAFQLIGSAEVASPAIAQAASPVMSMPTAIRP